MGIVISIINVVNIYLTKASVVQHLMILIIDVFCLFFFEILNFKKKKNISSIFTSNSLLFLSLSFYNLDQVIRYFFVLFPYDSTKSIAAFFYYLKNIAYFWSMLTLLYIWYYLSFKKKGSNHFL
jgi:hypothetical protein